MECSVFDTYVTKKNGEIMHFDIIVPTDVQDDQVYHYGREYLDMKQQSGQQLSATECRFCHIEKANTQVEAAILDQGYFILEMEGC